MYHFKSFSQTKSIKGEKALFIKGNELKLTQVELFSFFFLRVQETLIGKEGIKCEHYINI